MPFFIQTNLTAINNTTNRSLEADTIQKMKFPIKDFFNKCNRSKLRIWSRLLKKSLMENFIFCAVWSILSQEKLRAIPLLDLQQL